MRSDEQLIEALYSNPEVEMEAEIPPQNTYDGSEDGPVEHGQDIFKDMNMAGTQSELNAYTNACADTGVPVRGC